MSAGMVYLGSMADYPKFYEHKKNAKLPNRVADNATDAVNLEARGYTVVETKAAQKVADESTKVDGNKPTENKPNTNRSN